MKKELKKDKGDCEELIAKGILLVVFIIMMAWLIPKTVACYHDWVFARMTMATMISQENEETFPDSSSEAAAESHLTEINNYGTINIE